LKLTLPCGGLLRPLIQLNAVPAAESTFNTSIKK
jgi:hypothetical protein